MTKTTQLVADAIKSNRLTYEDDPGADVARIRHINDLLDNLAIDIADALFITEGHVNADKRNAFLERAGVR